MNRSTRNLIVAIIAIVVIIIAVFAIMKNNALAPTDQSGTATTTQQTPDTTGGTTSGNTTTSVSDGTLKITYLTGDFGLATNSQQILPKTYIPACDATFKYCVYYTGTAYKGTNFESAGIRVGTRADLTTEDKCLSTPPEGFSTTVHPTNRKSGSDYAASVFSNVGDAAAGHVAASSIYRLYVPSVSTCYEFETRVGQTQFANYPAGSIKEFTATNQVTLMAEMKSMLESISLPSGSTNLFS